jgi:hypothetical protein
MHACVCTNLCVRAWVLRLTAVDWWWVCTVFFLAIDIALQSLFSLLSFASLSRRLARSVSPSLLLLHHTLGIVCTFDTLPATSNITVETLGQYTQDLYPEYSDDGGLFFMQLDASPVTGVAQLLRGQVQVYTTNSITYRDAARDQFFGRCSIASERPSLASLVVVAAGGRSSRSGLTLCVPRLAFFSLFLLHISCSPAGLKCM